MREGIKRLDLPAYPHQFNKILAGYKLLEARVLAADPALCLFFFGHEINIRIDVRFLPEALFVMQAVSENGKVKPRGFLRKRFFLYDRLRKHPVCYVIIYPLQRIGRRNFPKSFQKGKRGA
jgi:hypothetical protein